MRYRGSVPLSEALMDYERARAPKEYRGLVNTVLKNIKTLVSTLQLHQPYVVFIKRPDGKNENSAAIYISGTMDYPVVAINVDVMNEWEEEDGPSERELYYAFEGNIVHELGHAYLESAGADTRDHDEEIIEQAARAFLDTYDPEAFKETLDVHLKDIEPEAEE